MTSTQEEIVNVVRRSWADVLAIEEKDVTLQSNFFADGGDSLTAVELVVVLSQAFDVEIPLDPLFASGTVESLANAVSAAITAI